MLFLPNRAFLVLTIATQIIMTFILECMKFYFKKFTYWKGGYREYSYL